MSDEMCLDGFHSIECPGCGMTTEERDEGIIEAEARASAVWAQAEQDPEFVAGVEAGLADIAAGRVVTLTREPERNSNPGTADVWYTPDCGHVHLSTDGTIYAACPEGVTLTREPGLDVERLARAIAKACPWHLRNENVPCAPNVAREYAALASEDRP